jgi:hypothetical protein
LPSERDILLQHVTKLLTELSGPERNELWKPLRKELNRHRSFANAAWAIPEAELIKIAAIVEKYSPQDAIEKIRPIFDEWWPKMGRNIQESQEQQTAERKLAIRSLYENLGLDGLLKLASVARLPHLIAENIPSILTQLNDYSDLLRRCLQDIELSNFVISFSVVALQVFGSEWKAEIHRLAVSENWSASTFARVILAWPDNETTWDFAEANGSDVSDAYWAEKKAFSPDRDAKDLNRLAKYYLKAKRSIDAIEALGDRITELPSETILTMLDEVVPELNAGRSAPNSMLAYYLNNIFEILQNRAELDRMQIAQREYALLPLIEHEERPLVLHKLMSQNAELYVQILSDVFREEGSESERSPSESEIAKARTAYSLLMQFKSVPGESNGKLDQVAMETWIADVQRLARSANRGPIADAYIGHILAHATPEAEIWPPVAICVTLEKLESPEIESGITTERFNMRGVVTKALFEGGVQERDIAKTYRKWLDQRREYPRTAALLDAIAISWDKEGEREDMRARQDKLRS